MRHICRIVFCMFSFYIHYFLLYRLHIYIFCISIYCFPFRTTPKVFTFAVPEAQKKYKKVDSELSEDDPKRKEILTPLLIARVRADVPLFRKLASMQDFESLANKGLIAKSVYMEYHKLMEYYKGEFEDVCREANALQEGWGKTIWEELNGRYDRPLNQLRSETW